MRLNQLRLRQGQAVLDDPALRALHAASPLVGGPALIDQGLGFSVDLRPEAGDLVGFRGITRRPVPEILPERILLAGFALGIALFVGGDFLVGFLARH